MAQDVAKLPAGYTAVPISEDQAASWVRVCVVVAVGAGGAAGSPLVALRSGFDSVTYLGCLVDRAGGVHEWLEVSVQSPENVLASPQAVLESLSNSVLDERWRVFAGAAAALPAGRVYRTGFEDRHPLPTWLDPQGAGPVHPAPVGAGGPWALYTDDAALAGAGLPVYSATLDRVATAVAGGERRFAGLRAAQGGGAQVASDLPQGRNLAPFNPTAGLLLVRAWAPLALDEFADALASGVATSGLRVAPRLGPPAAVSAATVGSHVFLATAGRSGRLLEGLHLRLRVLGDAVGAVRECVRRTQAPLLNVSPASFRVHLGEEGSALPVAWAARATLVVPGEAVMLRAAAADVHHYLRAGDATSVFFPDSAGRPVRGRSAVRLRQVEPTKGGDVIVSLTLQTQERLSPSPSDLAWVRLPLGRGAVDLSGTLESGAALAAGEWRFRSAPHRLDGAAVEALRGAEGRTIPEVVFESVPLLSTPCDLYSLGVVSTRLLLVNRGNTLALALDEVLSLARQLAVDFDPDRPLPERIAQIFAADRRWIEALGPQRLVHEEISPEAAIEAVPPILWYGVLAMIVRMFPGVGADSTCRDFGDARPGGLHTVFDRACGDADLLVLQSRSLIVNDLAANREIHTIVEGYLAGLGE